MTLPLDKRAQSTLLIPLTLPKHSGNYMYHMLHHYKTVNLSHRVNFWISYDSHNNYYFPKQY